MKFQGRDIHTIYFVGIKGIAMSSLAVYCKERGLGVVGSDIHGKYPSDEILSSSGIPVSAGFEGKNIIKYSPDLVIYTGAHNGGKNAEVLEALALGIPVLPHGKALGLFMSDDFQISVCGCHGKTTTTAMIATILKNSGKDPSYIIGSGAVRGLGNPGHYGSKNIFVAEADEYATDPVADTTPRFMWQKPDMIIVTNVDYDHPDIYTSLDHVKQAYKNFCSRLSPDGRLIINQDDANSQYLRSHVRTVQSVGSGEESDFKISDIHIRKGKVIFVLTFEKIRTEIELMVMGFHNVQNAAMAAAASYALGVSWIQIKSGLATFGGAKRRFEIIGQSHDVLYIDDYAHHPAEIKATLKAAKMAYPDKNIIAVFQPHTYSRTKSLLEDFAAAFIDAHTVILTDIYASAREKDTMSINGKSLADATKKHSSNVFYTPDKASLVRRLKTVISEGSIVIFMGAGDIYTLEQDVLRSLHI